MMKRILCALLCGLLLLSLAFPALAAEEETEEKGRTLSVFSREQFLWLAENCRLDSYSQNLTVSLKQDLDLTGLEFPGIPIFCGTFDGQGHTISGLSITAQGSDLGLFRYLTESALVKDLNLQGQVLPQGSRENTGGIAGINEGTIQNCSFEGTISGSSAIGGIAGENGLSGIIEGCSFGGTISGSHFIGGIAGKNSGVIRSCENTAAVNTTVVENTVSLEDITLESMVSSESASTVTDVGGIAGHSTGVIRTSRNSGNIGYKHMGYNIGGIAGTQGGYIILCENEGTVQGRKEVGGIAGQMEPAARIEYEEDALQILKRQVNSLSATVSKTASNAQNAGDSLYGKVYDLKDHVETAKESIELLTPDLQDPQLPDKDTLQAAKNGLSSSLSGMGDTMRGMQATVESSMGKLSNNLHTLQNQLSAMSATLNNAAETLGGSITDISDDDTPEDLTGKIQNCSNAGSILADWNAGGIAGAIALENDLDIQEDLDILGENSLNFESMLRAVVLSCQNTGTVTAGKRAAGGIVGLQSLGLIRDCGNSGTVKSSGGEYVGGIAGQSRGYIRASFAKCALEGGKNLGGIAGSGAVVTDCRSLVRYSGDGENTGAILGKIEQNNLEEEIPVSGNCYLPVDRDLGGIGGVSYDGQAQGLKNKEFFRLPDLPELFHRAKVTFAFENGRSLSYNIQTGGPLDESIIPALPEKKGQHGRWEGMAEENLDQVYLDLRFDAAYDSLPTVIESQDKQLLLQGIFQEGTVLTLKPASEGISPDLAITPEETLLGAWEMDLSKEGEATALRLRLPEDCDRERIRLLVRSQDQWQETAHTLDGSYAVAELYQPVQALALIATEESSWYLPAAIGAALILAAAAAMVLIPRKKKA